MCAVSAMIDNWKTNALPEFPFQVMPQAVPPYRTPNAFEVRGVGNVSREEFEKLKQDFEAFKALLLAAKEYDKTTNQPNCEVEEKVLLVRKVADMLGVNVDEVFGH